MNERLVESFLRESEGPNGLGINGLSNDELRSILERIDEEAYGPWSIDELDAHEAMQKIGDIIFGEDVDLGPGSL
jgi:hypothetical protein